MYTSICIYNTYLFICARLNPLHIRAHNNIGAHIKCLDLLLKIPLYTLKYWVCVCARAQCLCEKIYIAGQKRARANRNRAHTGIRFFMRISTPNILQSSYKTRLFKFEEEKKQTITNNSKKKLAPIIHAAVSVCFWALYIWFTLLKVKKRCVVVQVWFRPRYTTYIELLLL